MARRTSHDVFDAPLRSSADALPIPGMFLSMTNCFMTHSRDWTAAWSGRVQPSSRFCFDEATGNCPSESLRAPERRLLPTLGVRQEPCAARGLRERTARRSGAPLHSLLSVQMLRALAAAMVVLHHIQLNLALGFGLPEALPNLAVGSAGVDIFFGISGFVMVISSDRLFARPGAAKTFITRRLIRIVPLYWAVTSIYVVALGGGYTLAH